MQNIPGHPQKHPKNIDQTQSPHGDQSAPAARTAVSRGEATEDCARAVKKGVASKTWGRKSPNGAASKIDGIKMNSIDSDWPKKVTFFPKLAKLGKSLLDKE